MNYKKIEEQIDNKFRDLFELFNKIKIVGKTSTIIMYGKKYYVDCSIKPINENLTKHNNDFIQDLLQSPEYLKLKKQVDDADLQAVVRRLRQVHK